MYNIILNVDEYIKESLEKPAGETIFSLQRKLMGNIYSIASKNNAKKLIVNGNIASILQDLKDYTIIPSRISPLKIEEGQQFYPMGNLGELEVIVETFRRWDENRITFVNYNDEIVYDGLIIDEYRVLI